jgi:hypothetical protein
MTLLLPRRVSDRALSQTEQTVIDSSKFLQLDCSLVSGVRGSISRCLWLDYEGNS